MDSICRKQKLIYPTWILAKVRKGANWLARMLALRDDPSLGPLRIAYLEALLRAADWTASRKAEVQDA